VLGRQKFPEVEKARTGISGVIWSVIEAVELPSEDLRDPTSNISLSIVPLLPLSGKFPLHVHTDSGSGRDDRRLWAAHAPFVFISRAER